MEQPGSFLPLSVTASFGYKSTLLPIVRWELKRYKNPTFMPYNSALDLDPVTGESHFDVTIHANKNYFHNEVPTEIITPLLFELDLPPPAPLNASIDGPLSLRPGELGDWRASAIGGTSREYAFNWKYRLTCPPDEARIFVETCDEWQDGGSSDRFSKALENKHSPLEIRLIVRDRVFEKVPADTAQVSVFVISETEPPVARIRRVPEATNGAFVATIQFSQPVTGFEMSDLLLPNSLYNLRPSNFSGSGTTYSVRLTPPPAADGSPYHIQVLPNVAKGPYGDGNTASRVHRGTYDGTGATVKLGGVPENSDTAFEVTIEFDEAVTGFAEGKLALQNLVPSHFSGEGATYQVTLTPSEPGPYSVRVPADVAMDWVGNGNSESVEHIGTYRITAPTVELRGIPEYTNAAFHATITFSEAVTGFRRDDFELENLEASDLSGEGATYSLTLKPEEEGRYSVRVPANVVTDKDGHGNADSDVYKGTYDGTNPIVTISGVPADTNAAFVAEITFSEAVTEFEVSDLLLKNLVASEFSESGATYYVMLTPTEEGPYSVQILADVAKDLAGNENMASVEHKGTYRGAELLVTITGVPAVTNAAFEVSITFSEQVTEFAASDLSLVNLTASDFSGSGKAYKVTLTPGTEGTYSVQVPADAALDAAGNGNTASVVHTGKYDSTAPTVTIAKVVDSEGEVSSNGAFDVAITFSETVSGFAALDLALTNLNASNFMGSGATYSATLTPEASGDYKAQVPANAGLDLAGNGNTASNVLTGDYDDPRPTVTISGVPAHTHAADFDATITFSELVTGFAASNLALTNLKIIAEPQSVILGATYQVTLAPIAEGEFSVQVPADVATNLAGNGNTASQTHTGEYDITAPTVTIAMVVAPEEEVSSNGAFDVAITFSETVTGFAPSDLALTNLNADNFEGSGATYSATLTPVASGAYSAQVPLIARLRMRLGMRIRLPIS